MIRANRFARIALRFSELSESSGLFSEQLSEFRDRFSECECEFPSRSGISRLEQYENHAILGATPGAILGIDGNPHESFSFAPAFSKSFFKNWGRPRKPEKFTLTSLRDPVRNFLNSDYNLPTQGLSKQRLSWVFRADLRIFNREVTTSLPHLRRYWEGMGQL